MLLALMAAPFSSRKSLLRLSCPGMGLTITMAAPRARAVAGQQLGAALRPGEHGVDGDAGDGDVGGRHAPGVEVAGALLRGGEVVVAGLVDPQAVGLEVGGGGDLRGLEGALPAQRGDDL